jgi:hypothetical protein
MAFSELPPKTRKIGPSSVKITYDSKHVVWVEKISFSAKWAFRPNELFGQMGFSAK